MANKPSKPLIPEQRIKELERQFKDEKLKSALFENVIDIMRNELGVRVKKRAAKLARSLAEANEEWTQLVLHDNLTKLPNRTLLEDRLNQAIHKASREQGHFALMFCDLDGFKVINDSLGHHIGDLLLVEVAQRINGVMRAQDTVARLGGDEFVMLVELKESNDAMQVAEKLLNVINETFQIQKHVLHVSASIGIAIYPEDGSNRHDLVINADAAMYHTKRSRCNGYDFFEASMNVNAHNQLQWLQDLRVALEREEFILHYQPKYNSPNGSVVGAEALLRWQHPVYGLVGPDEFIALAERSGLIVPIGEWVLDEACRQMKEWFDLGHEDWTIAVNLSALQFAHSDLIDLVKNTLARHSLPACCLTLEVTESTAMYNAEKSLSILQKISDLGVDISSTISALVIPASCI